MRWLALFIGTALLFGGVWEAIGMIAEARPFNAAEAVMRGALFGGAFTAWNLWTDWRRSQGGTS